MAYSSSLHVLWRTLWDWWSAKDDFNDFIHCGTTCRSDLKIGVEDDVGERCWGSQIKTWKHLYLADGGMLEEDL
jgi:hypothetical protein